MVRRFSILVAIMALILALGLRVRGIAASNPIEGQRRGREA